MSETKVEELARKAGVSLEIARSVIGYCGGGADMDTLLSHCQRPDAGALGHPMKDRTIGAAAQRQYGSPAAAARRLLTRSGD